MKKYLLPLVVGSSMMLVGMEAVYAEFPDRPVTIVVPFPAGGTMDQLARRVGQGLNQAWQQPVIIENKPGGGTSIGTRQVAQSAPDGYTLGMVANSFAINASLLEDLPYDTRHDFTPVALLAYTPHVLVSRKDLPASTLQGIIDFARDNPGKLSFASFGTGTSPHLAIDLFQQQSGTKVEHIPYKGQAQALNDLLGGHVDLLFTNLPDVLPHLDSGSLKAIAIADQKRATQIPAAPTLSESGLPGFESNSWFGVIAPNGLSDSVLQTLAESLIAVVENPEFSSYLSERGLQADPRGAAEFSSYVASETDKAAGLIKASGGVN